MRLGCKGTKCKKMETKKQVKEQQNLCLAECHDQKIKLLQFAIHESCHQVWAGPLSGGRVAVVLWNRGSAEASITANWSSIGLNASTVVDAHNLWTVSMDFLLSQTSHYFSCSCLKLYSFLLDEFSNLFVVCDFVWLQNEVTSSVQGELKETVDTHACKMYVLTPKQLCWILTFACACKNQQIQSFKRPKELREIDKRLLLVCMVSCDLGSNKVGYIVALYFTCKQL